MLANNLQGLRTMPMTRPMSGAPNNIQPGVRPMAAPAPMQPPMQQPRPMAAPMQAARPQMLAAALRGGARLA